MRDAEIEPPHNLEEETPDEVEPPVVEPVPEVSTLPEICDLRRDLTLG